MNSFQLVCLGPNLKEIAKKFTYAEVWGLAVSKDGLNAFNARNNDTTVSDLSELIYLMKDITKPKLSSYLINDFKYFKLTQF